MRHPTPTLVLLSLISVPTAFSKAKGYPLKNKVYITAFNAVFLNKQSPITQGDKIWIFTQEGVRTTQVKEYPRKFEKSERKCPSIEGEEQCTALQIPTIGDDPLGIIFANLPKDSVIFEKPGQALPPNDLQVALNNLKKNQKAIPEKFFTKDALQAGKRFRGKDKKHEVLELKLGLPQSKKNEAGKLEISKVELYTVVLVDGKLARIDPDELHAHPDNDPITASNWSEGVHVFSQYLSVDHKWVRVLVTAGVECVSFEVKYLEGSSDQSELDGYFCAG